MSADWTSLNSSNVAACAYDAERRELQIRFNSGRTYAYSEVPPDVYEGLLAADSPGSFVNDSIKGIYTAA